MSIEIIPQDYKLEPELSFFEQVLASFPGSVLLDDLPPLGALEETASVALCQEAAASLAVSGRVQVKGVCRTNSLNPSELVPDLAPTLVEVADAGLGAVHLGPSFNLSAAVAAMVAGDPPLCITGGQSAEGEKERGVAPKEITQTAIPSTAIRGVSLRPDWFNFTVKCQASEELAQVERLKSLLGADWETLDYGMLRYQNRVKCGSIDILWSGVVEGMGVHVQISGMGISELEARGVTDWRAWLADRLSEGSRFARTDMAFDVRDGSLTVDMVETAARAGLASSHFDTLEPVLKFDGKGNVTDRGFNFGHRSADTSIVFYDKALEQQKKRLKEGGKSGLVDAGAAMQKQKELEASWALSSAAPALAGEGSEQWTRCELRNRNKRAQALVERIVAEGWGVVAGVLSAALDLKEPGEQTQRCRWASAPWWVAFLNGAEKARLELVPEVRTLERGMAALERQYGPLLAACGLVVPDFWNWAQGVATRRLERLSKTHWSMVAAYVERRDAAPDGGGARHVVPIGGGNVVSAGSV